MRSPRLYNTCPTVNSPWVYTCIINDSDGCLLIFSQKQRELPFWFNLSLLSFNRCGLLNVDNMTRGFDYCIHHKGLRKNEKNLDILWNTKSNPSQSSSINIYVKVNFCSKYLYFKFFTEESFIDPSNIIYTINKNTLCMVEKNMTKGKHWRDYISFELWPMALTVLCTLFSVAMWLNISHSFPKQASVKCYSYC